MTLDFQRAWFVVTHFDLRRPGMCCPEGSHQLVGNCSGGHKMMKIVADLDGAQEQAPIHSTPSSEMVPFAETCLFFKATTACMLIELLLRRQPHAMPAKPNVIFAKGSR